MPENLISMRKTLGVVRSGGNLLERTRSRREGGKDGGRANVETIWSMTMGHTEAQCLA